MIAFRSFAYAFERDLTVRLNGRMSRMKLRAAMGPGSRNLKLAGETEQGAFVRWPTDKLHADGQSTGAFSQRQRHGGLTGNVERCHIDVVLAHAGFIVGPDVHRHVIEAQWTRTLRQRGKQYRIVTRGHRRDLARRHSDSLSIERVLDSARGAASFDACPRHVGQLVLFDLSPDFREEGVEACGGLNRDDGRVSAPGRMKIVVEFELLD